MGADPTPFSVRSDRRNDVARVALRGELDLATVPMLEDHLADLQRDGMSALILDLRQVTFIDSAGLRALLRAWSYAKDDGHRFAIVGVSERARQLLELTGTERILDEPAGLELLERFTLGRRGHRRPTEDDGADRG